MRNFFKWTLLASILFVLFSCQKEQVKTNTNDQLISKVKSWLETQQSKFHANKAANIDKLKQYIDYSNLRIEDSDNGEKIVSIPITENFYNDKNAIQSLVLLLNKAGNIRQGNIVLFNPKVNGAYTIIPNKVFPGIYSTAKVNVDGKFRFLNIGGRWIYQLEYENGMPKSFGLIKTKGDASTANRTNSDCLDWYLITNWYDSEGNYVGQTSEYVTTTCPGSCGNPENMTLCPQFEDGGNDDYYQYAISRPWKWGITYTSNWYAESYETVTGVKNSNEPQGGHFTSISHVSSYFTASAGYTWEELGNTVSIDNPQKVYSSTTGKAIAPGGGYNVYSRPTDNRFDILFP